MTVYTTASFAKQFAKLPPTIRKKADKKLLLLAEDSEHPSLRAKKMQNTQADVWEARIDYRYRITFQYQIKDGKKNIILRSIGTHSIYRKVA